MAKNPSIPHNLIFIYCGCNFVTLTLAFFFIFSDPFSCDRMNPMLLAGTLSLALGVFIHHSTTFSFRHALFFLIILLIITTADELISLRWGIPFGQFQYNKHLKPMIPGGLPLFIPFSWYVLAYTPLVFLRRIIIKVIKIKYSILIIVAACAIFLTTIDLLIEPVATALDMWSWLHSGPYFKIPTTNFIGWLVIGFFIYLLYFSLIRTKPNQQKYSFKLIDTLLVIFSFLLTILLNVTIIIKFKYFTPLLITLFILGPFYGTWLFTNIRSKHSQ